MSRLSDARFLADTFSPAASQPARSPGVRTAQGPQATAHASRRGWMRRVGRGALLAGLAGPLAACGFRMRRATQLPFRTLYTNLSPNGSIGLALRRELSHSEGTELVSDPKKAEVRLTILQEVPEREVVAYSSEGRAREYELRLRVRFVVSDAKGNDLIPESEITLRREISNADNQLTARADEEAMLFRDMSNDMAHQLLWRLAAIRPAQ